MNCYCSSKHLYSPCNESSSFTELSSKGLKTLRSSSRSPLKRSKSALLSKNLPIFQKAFEICSITLPPAVPLVDFSEIQASPLSFFREFVAKNVPCVIKNAINSWPALDLWQDPQEISQQLAENPITVDLTPDGFADAIKGPYFLEPWQQSIKISRFLQLEEELCVGYIQKQNDNLNTEFKSLLGKGVGLELRDYFAGEIFEKHADACNFWMGKSASVSSLHKDPYENIYAVVQGEKHFTLVPPVCAPSLCEGQFVRNRWEFDEEKQEFFVREKGKIEEGDLVKWLCANPDLEKDLATWPEMTMEENLWRSYHVVVEKGDVLYLPALWFHQVSQVNKEKQGYTIAVNFWFDMEFGSGFALMDTLFGLKEWE